MQPQMTSVASSPTVDTGKDLFVLSDEQILDIAPVTETPSDDGQQAADAGSSGQQVSTNSQTERTAVRSLTTASSTSPTSHESPVTSHDSAEPPPWLAAQMKDAWGGEEAREFWNGVQQARTETAAYRAAFATPEDARALKELYPGGVSEARAAAERGRLLEEIDRAYFGAAGNSPEQLSASRAQLAQRMLREDPAAFREMVAAGLQALQEAGQGSGGAANQAALPRLAQVFGESRSTVGAQHAAPQPGNTPADNAHVAAYAAFERAANEDLQRSVGGAIERTLAQALPSFEQHNTPGQAGAQRAAPLRERLAASVRADVEKALQGDRQLGEQVAQILSSRRFDNDSRAQVVRLIADRAQQLVPGAAKRVLNDWTQTTLAAHRGRMQCADSASATDVAPAFVPARPVGSEQRPARRQDAARGPAQASATKPHPLNYRKLSDEQILDM
jgi:hypothetical protein